MFRRGGVARVTENCSFPHALHSLVRPERCYVGHPMRPTNCASVKIHDDEGNKKSGQEQNVASASTVETTIPLDAKPNFTW